LPWRPWPVAVGGSDGAAGLPGADGADGTDGTDGTSATAVVNVAMLSAEDWASLNPVATVSSVEIEQPTGSFL